MESIELGCVVLYIVRGPAIFNGSLWIYPHHATSKSKPHEAIDFTDIDWNGISRHVSMSNEWLDASICLQKWPQIETMSFMRNATSKPVAWNCAHTLESPVVETFKNFVVENLDCLILFSKEILFTLWFAFSYEKQTTRGTTTTAFHAYWNVEVWIPEMFIIDIW